MLLFENIALAFASLKSNKMRSILTMLGIIIGIASVIAIDTVGNSLSASMATSMESMGANNITVGLKYRSTNTEKDERGFSFEGPMRRRSVTKSDYITNEMMTEYYEEFKDSIKDIAYTASMGSTQKISINGKDASISCAGINKGQMESKDYEILYGRTFDDAAYIEGKNVALISDYAAKKLFGEANAEEAIGKSFMVEGNNRLYDYLVVGVYKYEDEVFSMESDDDVETSFIVPVRSVQDKLHIWGCQSFTVVINTGIDADDFMDSTETFFDQYYHKNEYFTVSASSMASMIEELTSLLSKVSLAISIIAGISLVVGGIGVMNIMLVSISERTKEIGTRKALGATNGSIRTQFIVEAMVLCLVGGVIGIVIGVAGGSFASEKLNFAAQPSVKSIILSVVFSLVIGVFFGYYPANKAAKMNPIDALRYE